MNRIEKSIVMPFIKSTTVDYENGKCIYRLYFKNGDQIIAKYLSFADSDNGKMMDDPIYEEYYDFDILILKVEKKMKDSTLNLRKNRLISFNYHNFPIKWELLNNYKI